MVTSLQRVVKKEFLNGPMRWSGVVSLDLLVQSCLVADRNNAPTHSVPLRARQGTRDGLSVFSDRCIYVSIRRLADFQLQGKAR
jgi:hypothetical protein